MEAVRLEHLLQVVGALEAVVLRAFGPHGGQVLFTRDTGQAELSRTGARILTVLRLDNPLAKYDHTVLRHVLSVLGTHTCFSLRMIVSCASAHSARTGDGSKTFVLLLVSMVRRIAAAAYKDPEVSLSYRTREDSQFAFAHRLANELLSLSLLQLDDLLTGSVLPYVQRLMWQDLNSTSSPIQKLLSSFFHTRLGYNNRSFISTLVCQLLSDWTPKNDQPFSCLQFLNDMWPALYTPVFGFPFAYSKIIEGQVIHRDFAMPLLHTLQGPVKAVVLNGHLYPQFLDAGEVLHIGNSGSILHFSSFAESSLKSVIAYLGGLGVSVLLSSEKQSVAVLALTAQAHIHVVECISQEELALFMHLSGATPISDYWNIQAEHVVSLEFCKPILLGANRYVHVGFPEKDSIRPCSLVICGAGESQTEQHAAAVHDAIQMLLTTWQPPTSEHSPTSTLSCSQSSLQGCVIAAGGTFEFLLSHALQQRKHSQDTSTASQILADSLLCVPRHIYSHHPRRFAHIQSEILKCIQEHGASPFHCQTPTPTENATHFQSQFPSLDPGLESVFCKYQLLLSVLQCVSQLFRVDTVIHTRGRLKTISRTNISWEDSEDELES